MEQLRMGIIGIGNMGSAHAVSIDAGRVPGMVLGAVCDIRESRRAWAAGQLPGVAVYSDAHELIHSGKCDAVLIATPHYGHPPLAQAAFEAGLHVLSEKPAGVAVSQVQKMNQAAKQSGKVFGIMFNQRTHPLFQKARELVQTGGLGLPKRLQWTVTNWYRTQDTTTIRAHGAPHGRAKAAAYCSTRRRTTSTCGSGYSACRAVCAPTARWGKYHRIEVEDEAAIYAEYDNGATAVFLTSTGEYPGTNRLEIAGDRGKLVLEDGRLKLWTLPLPEREFCFSAGTPLPSPEYTELLPDRPETAHNGILSNFADAVLHWRSPARSLARRAFTS